MNPSAQKSLEDFRAVVRLIPSVKPAELRILLSLVEVDEPGATVEEIKAKGNLSYNAAYVGLRSLQAAGYVVREGRRNCIQVRERRRVRSSSQLRMHYRLSLAGEGLSLAQGGGR